MEIPGMLTCFHLKVGGSSGTFCLENILLGGEKPELQGLEMAGMQGDDFRGEKCSRNSVLLPGKEAASLHVACHSSSCHPGLHGSARRERGAHL